MTYSARGKERYLEYLALCPYDDVDFEGMADFEETTPQLEVELMFFYTQVNE